MVYQVISFVFFAHVVFYRGFDILLLAARVAALDSVIKPSITKDVVPTLFQCLDASDWMAILPDMHSTPVLIRTRYFVCITLFFIPLG